MIRIRTSRQVKPAVGKFRPSAVGKKLKEVMCAVGKMLISSKSRAQTIQQFWNPLKENSPTLIARAEEMY